MAILERLELADLHVVEADRIVRQQHTIVRVLERDGHDASMAKLLLAEFEHTLALYREDRARIRAQLEAAPK